MDDFWFNIGELVRLNGGGPALTVEKVDREEIRVLWFIDGVLKTARIHPECLSRIPVCHEYTKEEAEQFVKELGDMPLKLEIGY